jgi:hypothetical protein
VFYKHEHLEKKLRENGRSASAEILGMRTEGSGNSAKAMFAEDDDLSVRWTFARLHLRVMPEGEPAFEATIRTRLHTFKYKGDTVPVLYDPDDHDKVVVDSEADMTAATGRQTLAMGEAAGAAGFAREAAAIRDEAADIRHQADEFRDQAAEFRARTDLFRQIAEAKAAGNQAEVERLKAQFLAMGPPAPPG